MQRKEKYCKVHFRKKYQQAADSIYSPNRFELLNCEATENDESDRSYQKDTNIVGSDTINHHSR